MASAPGGIADRVQVDELLRALPQGEIFHLFREQVLAHSSLDPGKQWASSSTYVTYDKRTLARSEIDGVVDAAFHSGLELYRALFEAHRAVMEAAARRDPVGTVRTLIALGDIFDEHQRRRSARACYEKALDLGVSLSESSPHLLALRRMGRLSQSVGELDRAYSFYQSAYNLARDCRDPSEASAAATGLGNIKVDQGKWEQAEHHYAIARRHAEEVGDEFQMGQLWNNLSVVRRRTGDLQGAIAFSNRALHVFQKLESPGELSRCYNNLGLIQVEQREFAQALQSYEKAVGLAESPFVVAAIHANLCELYLSWERYSLAEERARQGEEIALRHGFNLILINIYRLLGTLSRVRRDANGVTFFEKAIEISRQYQYLHAQAEAHLEYALFRQALNEPEDAVDQLERALALYRHLDARNDIARVESLLRRSSPEVRREA